MATMVQEDDRQFDKERAVRVYRRFIKKPDSKARDEAISKIDAEIKKKDAQLAEVYAQIDKVVVKPEIKERRRALISEVTELRKTSGTLKEKRDIVHSKIREIEAQMKRKINEVQAVTSKYSYKTVQDIDNKIQRSEDEISSGSLSLVDERRNIKEISSLRKLRKDYAGLENQQKSIDADRAKIAELKGELSELNSRGVNAKLTALSQELDALSLSNKDINDKRDELFQRKNAISKEKDTLYSKLRAVRADYDESLEGFRKAMADEQLRVANEEKKLKAEQAKSERKAKLEKELNEASKPAFEEEIDTIHTLINYFDPTYVKPSKAISFNTGSVASGRTGRTIAGIDDFEIIKKDTVDFISGTNARTKKGGNKKLAKKFTLGPEVIANLGDIGVALPLSKDDVPRTIGALQTKLKEYQASQEETTKKNVEVAKAKIAKMEAEWAKQDAKEAEAEAKAKGKADTKTDSA